MTTNSRNILLISISSLALIMLLNLVIGTYYDEYDIFLSNFAYLEINAPLDYSNNYTSMFLLAPIFSFLTKYCFNNYNIFNTFVLLFNLIVLTYNAIILLKIKKPTIIILSNFLILLFFIDIFISISNRKIACISVFSILFLTYNYYLKNISKKTAIGLVFVFTILCNTVRFEISMIAFGISIFIAILYQEKYLKNKFVLYLLVSISFFALFHILQNTVYKEFNFIEKAEHEFHDRGVQYYKDNLDYKETLKLQALSYYIIDSDNLDPNYYKELFLDKSIVLNKLNATYFSNYFNRLTEYYLYLFKNTTFLINLFSISALIFLAISKNHRKKIALSFLFILGLPILFFIYIGFPESLMLTLLNIFLFGVFVFVLKQKNLKIQLSLLGIISIILLFRLFSAYWKHIDYKTLEQPKLSYYRDVLSVSRTNHKNVVYASFIPSFEGFPSRLFAFDKKDVIPHYYLNMFFYAHYRYYTEHNNKFFSNITSFRSRILDIINKEAVFMSNNEYNAFIEDYAKNVCNLPIQIEPINIVDLSSYKNIGVPYFNAYQIKLID